MPKVLKIALLVLMCTTLATVALLTLERRRAGAGFDPLMPDDHVRTLSIPEFTLTAQDSTALTRDTLKGRVTIADFIFTHCPFICPTLTGKMKELSIQLGDTPVRFLSVSVDPMNDTPARLTEYAKENNADLARWTFATGEMATVKSIVTGGLKFDLEEDAEQPIKLPDGSFMNNIRHPSWLALIGPDAQVLGIYLASVPEDMQALEQRARAAAARIKK